jgi:uncharacterized membrane protein YbhN (UPF0104 family)
VPPCQALRTSSAPADQPESGIDVGRLARRAGGFLVVAAICVAALLTLPGVDDLRDRLANADPAWIAVVAACSLGSMLGFVRALWAAFDRAVRWRRAVVLGFAEQGANVLLPAGGAGGPALGVLVMRRAGVPARLATERHVVLFLATSAVSFFALVAAGTLVAAGVLPGDVSTTAAVLPAAGAGVVIALVALFARLEPPATAPSGRVRFELWRVRRFLHGGVRMTIDLLRHGDRLLIFGAVTYYACDVASLGASFQAFGGSGPPLGVFVLAYTLGHAGALLPTPGGIGGTEGGLIGMFVAYGAPLGLTTAAVLGYRVFQLGLPTVLGAASMLRIRHTLARRAAAEP